MFHQEKVEPKLNIMEYFNWVKEQRFRSAEEHHEYVSMQEQNFLQKVVYPMFYLPLKGEFETMIPFPLVLANHSSKKPIYVIDKPSFTIVFFSYTNGIDGICWEVSVHVKGNDCEERLNEFKEWYRKHYRKLYAEMVGMPKEFLYPKLNVYNNKVQDFSIEFWDEQRDFLLFKLFDLLRIY